MRVRSSLLLLLPLALLGCGAPGESVGTTEEPMTVCPGGSTLEGIDVSHWDGAVDWAKVKASGRAFAIAKATEGTGYVDPTFATNWAGMKQNGIARSAYHFFHSNMDPIVEADHFLQTMGPLEPGDLPPTLDLEVTDNQSAATITSTTIQWLDHVAAATGTLPILYTSPGFVNGDMGNPAGLENHAQLWVAHWNVKCPNVPAPFTTFAFWQYDDKGTVPGIPGASAVDLNKFNGDAADLEALTVQPMSSSATSGSSTSSTGTGSTSTTSSSSGAGGAGGWSATTSGGGTSDAAAVGVGGGSSASSNPDGSGTSGSGTSSPDESSGCATAPSRGGHGGRMALLLCTALLAIASHRTRRRRV